MSKEIGQTIALRFSEILTGDVAGLTPLPRAIEYVIPDGISSSSSNYSSSYPPSNPFKGDTSYWRPRSYPCWIQIMLRAPTITTGFRWNTMKQH